VPAVDGEPNVLPVDSEDTRANHWHTDVTFVLNPPQASTLRSIVVPPYGGETLIANTGAAYRDLPDPLRAFADTLRAVHTNDYDYAVTPESLSEADQERRRIFLSARYETAHPVVRVHPLTGERGLFIGDFAQRIVGLAKGESREILKILQQYVTRPENILRVTWEPGQLVLFDNRITQHYAVDNYDDAPGGCTASPWPAISRSASTAAPAIPSRATPPTTPRSPPSDRGVIKTKGAAPGETDSPGAAPWISNLDQPQRTPSDSSAERFACTDATARNASRR
jgi:hypothetical protein